MAAAREIGLADPVEVLPLDMAAQNMHPVSERQKAFAAEYQVTFAPDFDEKDAGAVLSRYDREDATGIPGGPAPVRYRKAPPGFSPVLRLGSVFPFV